MHFHCSRIDNTTQQRPFPSDRLRIKPSHEFPPSFQTCASCRVLHNVQCLSFQKLCQCNVDLRIDFDRIGTSFDIVNVQYWCVLLSYPVKSSSRRWTTAAAMFSNLKAQSFHEAALESKFTNLENARDSMNDLYRLGVPCSGSTSGLTSTSAASLFQRSNMSDN